MNSSIQDIAGRAVVAGNVVGYAASSYKYTHTSLYIVHKIDMRIEQRNHRVKTTGGDFKWEMQPTEIYEVCLRGFKRHWHDDKVRTYVRQIWSPKKMILIDDLSCLNKDDPIHAAIMGWAISQAVKSVKESVEPRTLPRAAWPFPVGSL